METKEFNAEKIRKVCEKTGFDIMGFIDLLDQQSTSITFYADGSVTKLPEKDRGMIIGRIRPLRPRSQTKVKAEPEPEPEAEQSQESSAPDVIKLGELMSPLRDKSDPKPWLKNFEDLRFKEKFADLSRAEVGDYVFANGVISKDPHAAEVLTGIIGWINPDKSALIGKRAYVITPETIRKVWAEDCYKFACTDLNDGWSNTQKLLNKAKNKGKTLPAVEYCANYAKRGVTAGEGFLAALHQLEAISPNAKLINQSLNKIGGDLWEGWIWSSSEYDDYYYRTAWVVYAPNGNVDWGHKTNHNYVRCVLAI